MFSKKGAFVNFLASPQQIIFLYSVLDRLLDPPHNIYIVW